MRDVYLPYWLLKFSYFNSGIYQLAFALGFISLTLIAYKLRQTRANEFTDKLLYALYTDMFWTGTSMFFVRPGQTELIILFLALPMLVSHIYLAIFMIRRYGIGGNPKHGKEER